MSGRSRKSLDNPGGAMQLALPEGNEKARVYGRALYQVLRCGPARSRMRAEHCRGEVVVAGPRHSEVQEGALIPHAQRIGGEVVVAGPAQRRPEGALNFPACAQRIGGDGSAGRSHGLVALLTPAKTGAGFVGALASAARRRAGNAVPLGGNRLHRSGCILSATACALAGSWPLRS